MGSENTDIDMPVIKFSNILMVPLSEDMDDESIDRLQDNVLRKVERHKPQVLYLMYPPYRSSTRFSFAYLVKRSR